MSAKDEWKLERTLSLILNVLNYRYSDSGDEGHDEKVRALPQWAQSPALADALYRQQRVNPDQIFGPIPPLSMQGKQPNESADT